MSQQSETFNIKAIADFSQPLREAERVRSKLDKEIGSAFRNMERGFAQPLGHITGRVDQFSSSLEASNARVLAFGASAGIIFQVSKAFKELFKNTIQVEKSMADIQVVMNANVRELENYRSNIFKIAKQTGQSFFEVSKAATELARQGLTTEKTLVRLKDALVLSRLSGMDTMDAVDALTAAINGFGEAVVNSTRLVDKFAEVDQKFAVSSKDLAEAFKRVGSTAVDAGVNIDELIALVTTAQQVTARGGSVIGNSLKTIFTRSQRPQVLDDLEKAGIQTKKFSGESLSAIDVLKNLANTYDKLTSSNKSFVSETVGGVFQINVLKALLKDMGGEFSNYESALKTSENAAGAAAKKNELLNKTLSSLINVSVENFRELSVVIGEFAVKPIVEKTLGSINSIVETIISKKNEFASVFDSIGKFLSGPVLGLVIGSVSKLLWTFASFSLKAASDIIGLTKRSGDLAKITSVISATLESQPQLYQRILSGVISVQQAERQVLDILRQQTAEKAKLMAFSSGAASSAFASGVRVDATKRVLTGKGFSKIPRFADPIREAVQREVRSGVPASSVKIGVDSRLQSPMNPRGIGVYNTIDEPMGIGQGINRAKSMGMNPKTHGIPNFATSKKNIYNSKTGQASENVLYGKGLRRDPLMLPMANLGGNILQTKADIDKYISQELERRQVLTKSKGKSRDLHQEYVQSLDPKFKFPVNISKENESNRLAQIAEADRQKMLRIMSEALPEGALLGPPPSKPSINPLADLGPAIFRSKRKSSESGYVLGGSQEGSGLILRPNSNVGQVQGPVQGLYIPEGKQQSRRFFDEFRKVLLDPSVAKSEKKTMIDAVSKGIEKGSVFSINSIDEKKLGEKYSVKSFQNFLKDFKGETGQFNKSQRDELKDIIYNQGLSGGGTSPLLKAGGLSFRERKNNFSVAEDVGKINESRSKIPEFETPEEYKKRVNSKDQGFYAKSRRTGKTIPISETRANQLRDALANRERRIKRGESPFVPVTISSPSELASRARVGARNPNSGSGSTTSFRQELIRQIRSLDPNITFSSAARLADEQLRAGRMGTGEDVIGAYREELNSKRSISQNSAGMPLRADLSSNKRYRYSEPTGSRIFSERMPTFGRASSYIGSKVGLSYTKLRNMDPMNKMMLLGGVGMLSSVGGAAFDSSTASNNRLSEMEKSNRNLISGGVQNTMTGAMIGASLTAGTGLGMLGGAAIGGLTAAAFSISKIFKEWNDILPEFEKNLSATYGKIQGLNNASQGMNKVLFDLENPPEFKTPEERTQYAKEKTREFKNSLANTSISPSAKKKILDAMGESRNSAELRQTISDVISGDMASIEPKKSLEEAITSITKYGRGEMDTVPNLVPMLSGISSKFGTLGQAGSKLTPEQLETVRIKLQNSLGRIGDIRNKTAALTLPPVLRELGRDRTGKEESPEKRVSNIIDTQISDVLQIMGVNKTSNEYQSLMKALRNTLKNGVDGAEVMVKDLKSIAETSQQMDSKFTEFLGVVEKVDIYAPREAFIEQQRVARDLRIGTSRNRYENERSIRDKQFAESFSIAGLSESVMTPTGRQIRELQLKRNTERGIAPIRERILKDDLSAEIQNQKKGYIESIGQDDSEFSKPILERYDNLLNEVKEGTVKKAGEYIDSALSDIEKLYKETERGQSKAGIESFGKISEAFESLRQQVERTNDAIAENEALSKQREDLLRKRLNPYFSTGDIFRSESASSNATRRTSMGSDPQTEIKSSMRAFREEMGYTTNDFYTDFENSSRDAAQTFKSEFKSAFQDFRRGTVSAGEALRQMAMNILDRIATNTSSMAIDGLMSAAFGGASNIFASVSKNRSGGMIRKRYATGGMVTGGSGVIDDVPALLTDGEMVINREAVRTYGADYFNKINQNRGVTGSLENRYIYLDANGNPSANPTQGQSRISAALSNIGATNDLMRANTTRMDREQRLVNYITQRRSYDYQKSQAMKKYNRGIRQQAIGAGISAGIGIGGGMLGSYMSSYSPPPSSAGTMGVPMGTGSNYSNVANSGAIVPRSGASNRDSYPYTLTGGEGVLRKEAVNMYGPQIVNDLNNGRVKTMRFGGSDSESSISEIRGLPSSIDRLSSAITSLQNKSNGSDSEGKVNNNFNFNIEVRTDNGQVSVNESKSSNQSQDSQSQTDNNKKIGEAVKIVAQQAIIDGLRTGGLIYNAIRRG